VTEEEEADTHFQAEGYYSGNDEVVMAEDWAVRGEVIYDVGADSGRVGPGNWKSYSGIRH
jgi:hypothetical protein